MSNSRLRVAALTAVFSLACDGLFGSTHGTLQVVVETEGDDFDVDGYIVTLDSTSSEVVVTNGKVRFPDIGTGRHHVTLGDVAENCLTLGEAAREVRVDDDDLAEVRFSVRCDMTGASLVINETGADGSLAGYTLDLDGGGPFQMLANFPRIVARLTSGTHTVALSGVPANCTVSGAPQRQFTVTARTLTTVAFNVTCAAYTGSIELRATTTGGDLDGDGYRARVDGQNYVIPVAGGIRINRLIPGTYEIELTGIAGHCTLAGLPTIQVQVSVGDTTTVPVLVTCRLLERLAVARGFDGFGEVLLVREDGVVEGGIGEGVSPTWSPDGGRIVVQRFLCDYWSEYCFGVGLFSVRLADRHTLQLNDGDAHDPDLSPDGRRVAFAAAVTGGRELIHVMISNGVDVRALPGDPSTINASEPDWSPDGSRILYACSGSGTSDICVMNADGTGFARITNDMALDSSPVWSPDGTRIAFATTRGMTTGTQIAIMNADGTGFRGLGRGAQPAWSRDGSRIAFIGGSLGPGLSIVNSDGTGLYRATLDAFDHGPAWRP